MVDPTAMDVDQPSTLVPYTTVQPGAIMAVYILGLSGPIPFLFVAFHHQASHIPNQTILYNQFAYNIPPNAPFSTLFTLLPNPLTLTQTSHKKTLQLEKMKHNLVIEALEQRLRLSQMVISKSSIVICYELQVFCLTTNQFDVFCSIKFLLSKGVVSRILSCFKANMMELGLLGVKCPNLYGICDLKSSR